MLKVVRILALGGVVTALLVMPTIVPATPPTGQEASTPLIGTLDHGHPVNTGQIKFHAGSRVNVATFTLTLAPGGLTGWHKHPGILLATVQSGAVMRQVGCESRTYGVGETFIEHGDQPTGQVTNASTSRPAVFSVTQIAPPGIPRRDDSQPPVC
jgi:quercetin dioxygenase-like cupin family protein